MELRRPTASLPRIRNDVSVKTVRESSYTVNHSLNTVSANIVILPYINFNPGLTSLPGWRIIEKKGSDAPCIKREGVKEQLRFPTEDSLAPLTQEICA